MGIEHTAVVGDTTDIEMALAEMKRWQFQDLINKVADAAANSRNASSELRFSRDKNTITVEFVVIANAFRVEVHPDE